MANRATVACCYAADVAAATTADIVAGVATFMYHLNANCSMITALRIIKIIAARKRKILIKNFRAFKRKFVSVCCYTSKKEKRKETKKRTTNRPRQSYGDWELLLFVINCK